MVNKIKIGIVGVQGAISEHGFIMQKVLEKEKIPGNVFVVRNKTDVDNIDAVILPGGESTTISNVLVKSGIDKAIIDRIEHNDLPVMGTCAGCVLLAKELTDDTDNVKLLQAMDMKVKRNAFGRQKNSFEQDININGFSKHYHAVFIRAPVIKKTWGNCKIISRIDDNIVMVKQDNLLALSFHPELTEDIRIHRYFLNLI